MAKFKVAYDRSVADVQKTRTLLFHCPGCKITHSLDRRWTWNESVDLPTVRASVLVNFRASDPTDPEAKKLESTCHSFITDGMIQFLDDCTHELRGITTMLPEWLEPGERP